MIGSAEVPFASAVDPMHRWWPVLLGAFCCPRRTVAACHGAVGWGGPLAFAGWCAAVVASVTWLLGCQAGQAGVAHIALLSVGQGMLLLAAVLVRAQLCQGLAPALGGSATPTAYVRAAALSAGPWAVWAVVGLVPGVLLPRLDTHALWCALAAWAWSAVLLFLGLERATRLGRARSAVLTVAVLAVELLIAWILLRLASGWALAHITGPIITIG